MVEAVITNLEIPDHDGKHFLAFDQKCFIECDDSRHYTSICECEV